MALQLVGFQTALLDEVVHDLVIGGDDAGEASGLHCHVGQGGPLVQLHVPDSGTLELQDLADALA